MPDMWTGWPVFAIVAGLGILIGAVAGGVVGRRRSRLRSGLCWGIVGGEFGGLISLAMIFVIAGFFPDVAVQTGWLIIDILGIVGGTFLYAAGFAERLTAQPAKSQIERGTHKNAATMNVNDQPPISQGPAPRDPVEAHQWSIVKGLRRDEPYSPAQVIIRLEEGDCSA